MNPLRRLFLIGLLCLPLTLFSSPIPGVKKVKPWKVGVEAGLDLSRFRASKELLSPDNCMGWFAGAKLRLKIPLANLGLDAALLYNQNKLEYVAQQDIEKKTLRSFLVPVNLRYNWTIESNFVLYFATGPQWNWYVGKKLLGSIGELEHSYFDWNVGLGIEVLKHVQLGLNYNIPLDKMGEVNNVNLEGHTWNIRFAFYF